MPAESSREAWSEAIKGSGRSIRRHCYFLFVVAFLRFHGWRQGYRQAVSYSHWYSWFYLHKLNAFMDTYNALRRSDAIIV